MRGGRWTVDERRPTRDDAGDGDDIPFPCAGMLPELQWLT